jgi:hypothetical protein
MREHSLGPALGNVTRRRVLFDVVDQPEALAGLGPGLRLSGDLLGVWVLGYLG